MAPSRLGERAISTHIPWGAPVLRPGEPARLPPAIAREARPLAQTGLPSGALPVDRSRVVPAAAWAVIYDDDADNSGAPPVLRGPAEDLPPPAAEPEPDPWVLWPVDPPPGYTGRSGITPNEEQQDGHFVPFEDRWRIGYPEWDRYDKDFPFTWSRAIQKWCEALPRVNLNHNPRNL